MSEEKRIPIDPATPTDYNTPTPKSETIGKLIPKWKESLIESMVLSPKSVLLTPASTTDCSDRKKRFVCTVYGCGKSYGKSSHLRSHMTWHSGEKPFICDQPFCGKGFTRSDELARHTRTHTGEKPYECTQCGKKFSRSDHLTKHLRVHYKYSKIDIEPMLEVSLNEETATNVVGKEQLFSVSIQPKQEEVTSDDDTDPSNSNRIGLTVSVKQEIDEEAEANFQNFDIYECGPAISEIKTEPERITTPPALLTSNMPSGNIELKRESNQINGSTPKRIKTSKTVTGNRPFHCWHPDCGKSFRRQDELNRHKRIHSGEKPFSCDHCEKKFLRSDHLKKHLKTHYKKFQVTDS